MQQKFWVFVFQQVFSYYFCEYVYVYILLSEFGRNPWANVTFPLRQHLFIRKICALFFLVSIICYSFVSIPFTS